MRADLRGTSTYGTATYGDRIAEVYDELYPFPDQTEAAVELLAATELREVRTG